MAQFRFQDLEIWKNAIEIGDKLLDIADQLEDKKLYRFAEQLRGAGLSVSNNLAEGSGSTSKAEFRQFLNIARRSAFEDANILIVMQRRALLPLSDLSNLLDNLETLCRRITAFQRTLH